MPDLHRPDGYADTAVWRRAPVGWHRPGTTTASRQRALWRRATEGGSWEVRASLSQTAIWMQQQPDVQPRPEQQLPADLLQECDGGFGRLRFLRPVPRMSLTPPAWTLPAVPLGTHATEWLPVASKIRGEIPRGQRPRRRIGTPTAAKSFVAGTASRVDGPFHP